MAKSFPYQMLKTIHANGIYFTILNFVIVVEEMASALKENRRKKRYANLMHFAN